MENVETHDYVVVGAGSAGCVIAGRLSAERDVTVAVLEAGGGDGHPLIRMPLGFMQALAQPRFTWGYESEPEPGLNQRVLPVPRGRLLGGSSSINGMFHIRGHRRDFDDWERLGCTGWGYRDVLPYFRRSETNWRGEGMYHGGSGPLSVNAINTKRLIFEPLKEAARKAGHPWNPDYDGADTMGFARGDVVIDRRGRRHSTARAYLLPAMSRPNLTVHSNARVRRILFEGRRAVGVEWEQEGQVRVVRARREVVLSGGSYGSPQLLMVSGVGPGAELQALGIPVVQDLPGVGKNLIEHPLFGLHYRARKPETFINELRFDRALVSVLRWAITGKGPFSSQIATGTILLKTQAERDRPDIQLLCSPVQINANIWFPGLSKRPPHGFLVNVCQLYAKSRGAVTLRSPDAAAKPRIQFNLFTHPDDMANLIQGIRRAREVFAISPQADYIDREYQPGDSYQTDEQLAEAIRASCGITHHPVGTCAMGTGAMAVVDPQLRVRGVDGLRVADASIMPSIVGGNTNSAAIMIGEKAADLLLGRRLPSADV